jgi:membrane protein DedA with SNARE-associated domain
MNQYGFIGILLLIAVENIFPPIPSEVILTFGGFMAAYSHLNLWGVIAAATAGSLLGAQAVYKAGSFFNAERLTKWLNSRPGRMLHLKRSDISRANGWFSSCGYKAVFLCRCVPLVRSLISLPAGMSRMRYIPFLLLTTAGSLIWNTALIWFGAAAGESWGMITKYTDIYTSVTVAVLGLATLAFGAAFIKRRFFSNKNTSDDISEDNLHSSETR